MKVEKNYLEDHQAEVIVEIEDDVLDVAKRKAAKQLGRNNKIPGFRPGKAPYQVLVRHIGEDRILNMALDNLIDELYPKAIEQSDIDPYGPGVLEDIKTETRPYTFKFIVPLAPIVELSEYREIREPYSMPAVTDEDVEKTLLNLQKNQAIVEPVERNSEETDIVYISLFGKIIDDGEDSETPPIANESYFPVVIGDEDSEEWPFLDFNKHLLGVEKGEKKDVSFNYPEDYQVENLRSKTATFSIEVKEIKSRTLPELNDEFAQSLGEYETLSDLKNAIRDDLIKYNQENYDNEYEDTLLNKIVEGSTFKFPRQMVTDETDSLIENLKTRLNSQNLDLDTYLRSREMSEAELREELSPVAENRIKRSLVLLKISDEEKIKVDQNKVQSEVTGLIDTLSMNMKERDKQRIFTQDAISGMLTNALSDAIVKNTVAHLKSIASGELEESNPIVVSEEENSLQEEAESSQTEIDESSLNESLVQTKESEE